MDYVPLGKSNLQVSRFCLGTMMFGGKTDEPEAMRILRRSLDAGVNFVDTADVYAAGKTEEIVGQALSDGGRRDGVVLASKAGMKVGPGVNDEGISRFHFVHAVEASLHRLRTDRIDLFYLHWPMAAMNLEETLRTLDDLVRAGKILYVGCSNFPAWLWCRMNWIADVKGFVPVACGQYPYNVIERGVEVEILPMARALGLGITIYRPLAVGVLTGKYLPQMGHGSGVAAANVDGGLRGDQDERCGRWTAAYAEGLQKLAAFAKSRGVALADVATAWVLGHEAVTSVIVGISRLAQLEENLRGFDFRLTPDECAEVGKMFPTEVWEETGGKFPEWRRRADVGGTM